MTAKEIVNKWIGTALPGDDAAAQEAIASIMAGMQEDIEGAIEENRAACERIAQLASPTDKSAQSLSRCDAD